MKLFGFFSRKLGNFLRHQGDVKLEASPIIPTLLKDPSKVRHSSIDDPMSLCGFFFFSQHSWFLSFSANSRVTWP